MTSGASTPCLLACERLTQIPTRATAGEDVAPNLAAPADADDVDAPKKPSSSGFAALANEDVPVPDENEDYGGLMVRRYA